MFKLPMVNTLAAALILAIVCVAGGYLYGHHAGVRSNAYQMVYAASALRLWY